MQYNGNTFNENEIKILKSLWEAEMNATAGDFGFLDEADRLGFKKAEFAGYVGSLKVKGAFNYLDSEGFMTNGNIKVVGQYHLNDDLVEMIKALK